MGTFTIALPLTQIKTKNKKVYGNKIPFISIIHKQKRRRSIICETFF